MTKDDPELGTVKRCRECKEWWPADRTFFRPRYGTCRACQADKANERPIAKRPTTHGRTRNIEEKRRRDRERKAALRRDPILGDKLRERQRQTQRRFYERHRATILDKRRSNYVERIGRPIRENFGRPRIAA